MSNPDHQSAKRKRPPLGASASLEEESLDLPVLPDPKRAKLDTGSLDSVDALYDDYQQELIEIFDRQEEREGAEATEEDGVEYVIAPQMNPDVVAPEVSPAPRNSGGGAGISAAPPEVSPASGNSGGGAGISAAPPEVSPASRNSGGGAGISAAPPEVSPASGNSGGGAGISAAPPEVSPAPGNSGGGAGISAAPPEVSPASGNSGGGAGISAAPPEVSPASGTSGSVGADPVGFPADAAEMALATFKLRMFSSAGSRFRGADSVAALRVALQEYAEQKVISSTSLNNGLLTTEAKDRIRIDAEKLVQQHLATAAPDVSPWILMTQKIFDVAHSGAKTIVFILGGAVKVDTIVPDISLIALTPGAVQWKNNTLKRDATKSMSIISFVRSIRGKDVPSMLVCGLEMLAAFDRNAGTPKSERRVVAICAGSTILKIVGNLGTQKDTTQQTAKFHVVVAKTASISSINDKIVKRAAPMVILSNNGIF
eukprot:TRINITY_DN578_c0_g1_i3.p1 TRINITY_DN578_c0_g1~~TRINITY_DN578_c0_g1_i3.p1  ORF type:complete len:484 (+),score=141.74 TRINITY_DN578_c0_g1_i3:603-2054(+)